MHVLDMWGEILSHSDPITCVNLILSNKYFYENFKHELPKYRYLTLKIVSRQTRGLNMFKDPYLWNKMVNLDIHVNKIYIQCSKGGIAKKLWINLSQVDLCKFLKFLNSDVIISKESWPNHEKNLIYNLNYEDLSKRYINHYFLPSNELIYLEWIDDLMDRSVYISRYPCSNNYLQNITKNIEERLSFDNDNFDMDMYCNIKSRRRKRFTYRQYVKQKSIKNNI